jgi:hypothetical protein
MKVEARLFLILMLFFGASAVIYYAASIAVYNRVEPIGETVFILTFVMTLMIWFYLRTVGRRMDSRPEDSRQAEVADGAGALGFFPPSSVWPVTCAAVAALTLLGPVFGWWLTLLGLVLGVWSICGWCYEFYVGDYRH